MLAAFIITVCLLLEGTDAFQDVTMAQMEYIANHISQTDCRRLVASLQSPSYEIDPRYVREGMKLPATTPCIQLLANWSTEEREDEVLALMTRRLHQLHYPDLAQWLSMTTFNELENQLREQLGGSKCNCKIRKEGEECGDQKVGGDPPKKTITAAEAELQPNSSIYNDLRGLMENQVLRINFLWGIMGLSVLAGVILMIVAVKMTVRWCCRCKQKKKGYRNLEVKFEPGIPYSKDFEEEFKKYCEC